MRRPRRHPMAMRRANPADPCRAPARTCRHTPGHLARTLHYSPRHSLLHPASRGLAHSSLMPYANPHPWLALAAAALASRALVASAAEPPCDARTRGVCLPPARHTRHGLARPLAHSLRLSRPLPTLAHLRLAPAAALDGPPSDALDACEARAGRLTPLATRRSPRAYLRPVAKDSQGLRSDASRSDACPSDAPRPSPRRHLAHRARAAHRRHSLPCRRSKRVLSPWPWARHVLPM